MSRRIALIAEGEYAEVVNHKAGAIDDGNDNERH